MARSRLARTQTIEGQAKRDPDEPGAKTVALAEIREISKRFHERFLRNVFRVGIVPKDTSRDSKCEGAGVGKAFFEFAAKGGALRSARPLHLF